MDIAGDQGNTGKQCIDASAQQRVGVLLARQSPEHGATLTRAIEAACHAHHDQVRKSGEPYYLHALAVAEILDELKLDYETLVAAVLHDVVEDTTTTIDDLGNDCLLYTSPSPRDED